MLNIILTDDFSVRQNLLPLSFTRSIADLRVGALTIAEKWQHYLPGTYSIHTEEYLMPLYRTSQEPGAPVVNVASHILPDSKLALAVKDLADDTRLVDPDGTLIAWRGVASADVVYPTPVKHLRFVYDIFLLNASEILADWHILTAGRESQSLPDSCTLIGPTENLFIEEGANVSGAVLNVTAGPIYIGVDAEVMECAALRGPVAVMNGATVRMGAKIYSATTIGPHCKVGGEIDNVVFLGYSNKAHDGYLGNAVIGEWCNLGAGCTASNLKNDYTEIKLWNYPAERFLRTGLQFCGLIMGDHSKAGINTMFNTATVVGVGVNIHGTGFPRNFVPSFSEGSTAGFNRVPLKTFLAIASRVMARREVTLTPALTDVYTHLYTLE